MNIYSIITLCGGLAFFLFGMHVMSGSLEKAAGGKLEDILKTLTSNPGKSLMLGAVITIAIQSSSALTGSITYGMAIPIIMGQNIGTCVTALLSSIGVNKNAKKVSVIHISFNLNTYSFYRSACKACKYGY